MKVAKMRLVRFALVGSAGFVVDVACYTLALTRLDPYAARIVGFACAVVFTWAANRTFTFARNSKRRVGVELARYVTASLISGTCNVGVYAALIAVLGHETIILYMALVAGIGCGLVSNYILYSRFVFEPAPV